MNSRPPDFQLALAHARSGQRAHAEAVCRVLLEADPRDADVLELMGVLSLDGGAPTEALAFLQRAMLVDASRPGVHFAHGNAAMALGRHKEALASYDRVLQLVPGLVEGMRKRGDALMLLGRPDEAARSYQSALEADPAQHDLALLLGDALLQAGRAAHACEAYDWLLARQPNDARAWANRGNAHYALGDFEQALSSYDRAIGCATTLAELYDNRGMALLALGRAEDAIASHGAAIERDPGFAAAWLRRAMAKRAIGLFAEALPDAERAVQLAPEEPLAWNARGIVRNDLGQYEDALEDYRQAIRLAPRFVEAWNNAGNALHDLGRFDEAIAAFEQALALRPGYPEAHSNRALSLQELARFDEARAAFDQAIASRPGFPEALKRRAGLRLLTGDFAGGRRDYGESLAARPVAGPAIPAWNGESLQGKSILLTEPNGFGDVFQYWRFVPVLRAMGAEVAFMGDKRLFRMLGSSGFGVRYLTAPDASDRFDYRCELWQIPLVLRSDPHRLPAAGPYLNADDALASRWAGVLDPDLFKVGIAWQGRADRKIDRGRSIPLRAFAALADLPGVQLISLQRGDGLEQLQEAAGDLRVVDPGPGFDAGDDAFIDAAALMHGLDLVVCSDSAIAHLAGAMGRPTWIALKHVPEWRWMLERGDSPWYPQVRLFRQRSRGDWHGVFAQMREALASRT